MRRVLLPALVVVCLGRAGPGPAAAETTTASLAQRLERRIEAAGIPESELGIAVLRLGAEPRPVFGKNQSGAFIPASVTKVLTAAAALDLLGPGYEFRTWITTCGAIEDGVLAGDLVVHGTGDPHLSGRGGREPTAALDAMVQSIRGAGVREVRGDLVLDDGVFDRDYTHSGWTDADKEKWYGAPVGGLAFNDSCLDVTVAPTGQPEERALLTLPATSGAWEVQNLTSVVEGSRHVVGATWSASRALTVRGQVALSGGAYTFHVPVPDPVAFFGGALRRRLEHGGVRVTGRMRAVRDDSERGDPIGNPDGGPRVLAEHRSALPDCLDVMNRVSQNFYAGQIFKACGAALEGQGTWESGGRAVEETLRRRGLSDEGKTTIVDGSGLARANRTTAATVALLLVRFDQDLLRGPLLHRSFAAPGEEGTLDDRLLTRDTKGRLRAKTGTLKEAGAHAIAGYLDGRRGEPGLCFAIFVNRRSWKGDPRGLIDDLVGILAAP